jgi:hypothetical protein
VNGVEAGLLEPGYLRRRLYLPSLVASGSTTDVSATRPAVLGPTSSIGSEYAQTLATKQRRVSGKALGGRWLRFLLPHSWVGT